MGTAVGCAVALATVVAAGDGEADGLGDAVPVSLGAGVATVGSAVAPTEPVAVGLAAAARIWGAGLRAVLPWRALALIGLTAAASTVPALVTGAVLNGAPILRLGIVGAVYTSVYAAATLAFGLLSDRERASLSELAERAAVVFPGRSLPKIS